METFKYWVFDAGPLTVTITAETEDQARAALSDWLASSAGAVDTDFPLHHLVLTVLPALVADEFTLVDQYEL